MSKRSTESFILQNIDAEILRNECGKAISAVQRVIPYADIYEVGSTAVPGVIGKQDIDVLARINKRDFNRARAILDKVFVRNLQQLSNSEYQGYHIPSDLDVALQLVVKNSRYDRFLDFLDALRRDKELVDLYNNLKLRWDGKKMSDYRKAKAAFIEKVLSNNGGNDKV